jgi:hypothetical protein
MNDVATIQQQPHPHVAYRERGLESAMSLPDRELRLSSQNLRTIGTKRKKWALSLLFIVIVVVMAIVIAIPYRRGKF